MSQFWRTKTFRELTKEWDQKLIETGFEDAEKESRGDRVLRQKSANSYRQASQLERESRFEYYSFLGYLAHNTQFPDELERIVMQRHSEGATIKEIVAELSQIGISRNRLTIRYIIRRWQSKWGIRTWTLQQMNIKKLVIK